MPQWCYKHKMHTIDELCPECQREREAPAKRIAELEAELAHYKSDNVLVLETTDRGKGFRMFYPLPGDGLMYKGLCYRLPGGKL